jgi:hypothetical protein
VRPDGPGPLGPGARARQRPSDRTLGGPAWTGWLERTRGPQPLLVPALTFYLGRVGRKQEGPRPDKGPRPFLIHSVADKTCSRKPAFPRSAGYRACRTRTGATSTQYCWGGGSPSTGLPLLDRGYGIARSLGLCIRHPQQRRARVSKAPAL